MGALLYFNHLLLNGQKSSVHDTKQEMKHTLPI
jgi:hypothetical protein